MHLICPNCDAEYLVDDSAIPATGRDVQCSNCGHAWFHLPQDPPAGQDDTPAAAAPPLPDAAPPAAPLAQAWPDDVTPDADEEPSADLPDRRVDDSVLAVLREEAEREAAARRAEGLHAADPAAAPVPTWPDDSDTAPEGDKAAARRAARLLGPDPEAGPAPARPPARRDLLPEIEEIDTRSPADGTDPGQARLARSAAAGFRNGFVLMLIVAACLVSVYAMAPRIVQQFPESAPAMARYVETVDVARLWVDDLLRRSTEYLRHWTGA